MTYLTPEGYIVERETHNVIGYKCTACSTAHTFEDDWSIEECADAVTAWQETHRFCDVDELAV